MALSVLKKPFKEAQDVIPPLLLTFVLFSPASRCYNPDSLRAIRSTRFILRPGKLRERPSQPLVQDSLECRPLDLAPNFNVLIRSNGPARRSRLRFQRGQSE